MIGCSFAWKEFVMESMRDVDRVMEREIKKGSTPLQFEQLGFRKSSRHRQGMLIKRNSF